MTTQQEQLIISVICCIILLVIPIIFIKKNLIHRIVFKVFYPIFLITGISLLIAFFVDKTSEEHKEEFLYMSVALITAGSIGSGLLFFK